MPSYLILYYRIGNPSSWGDLPADEEGHSELDNHQGLGPTYLCHGMAPFYVLKSTAAEMKQKLYLTKHIAGYNDSDLPARPNMRRVETGCSLAWMDDGGGVKKNNN